MMPKLKAEHRALNKIPNLRSLHLPTVNLSILACQTAFSNTYVTLNGDSH